MLSADKLYRHALARHWGTGPCALWIMLNPSTSDHTVDDPTIRKVCSFTRSWGLDDAIVVNFLLRSTDPRAIEAAYKTDGALNNEVIKGIVASTEPALIVGA